MKVTRLQHGYVIRCTDHEFDVLGIAVDQIEAGEPLDHLKPTGLRRSWARRVNQGPFLRVDADRRGDA